MVGEPASVMSEKSTCLAGQRLIEAGDILQIHVMSARGESLTLLSLLLDPSRVDKVLRLGQIRSEIEPAMRSFGESHDELSGILNDGIELDPDFEKRFRVTDEELVIEKVWTGLDSFGVGARTTGLDVSDESREIFRLDVVPQFGVAFVDVIERQYHTL